MSKYLSLPISIVALGLVFTLISYAKVDKHPVVYMCGGDSKSVARGFPWPYETIDGSVSTCESVEGFWAITHDNTGNVFSAKDFLADLFVWSAFSAVVVSGFTYTRKKKHV